MGQTFRRKLQVVFGVAVCASMGFGVAQVKASPAEAEDARLICPAGHIQCTCEVTYCVRGTRCPLCP